MKNRRFIYIFYTIVFICVLIMSSFCTIRYYKIVNTNNYEDQVAYLGISYVNGDTIKVNNNDYIDYSIDLSVYNLGEYYGNYSLYIDTNREVNVTVTSSEDSLLGDDMLISGNYEVSSSSSLGYGYISPNKKHYYIVRVSGNNLQGLELKVKVMEANNEGK